MKHLVSNELASSGSFVESSKKVLIGKYNNFDIIITKEKSNVFLVEVYADRGTCNMNILMDFLYREIGVDKSVKGCFYENSIIKVTLKTSKNYEEQLKMILDKVTSRFNSYNLHSGCGFCGCAGNHNTYRIKGRVIILCGNCYENYYEMVFGKKLKKNKKDKNIINISDKMVIGSDGQKKNDIIALPNNKRLELPDNSRKESLADIKKFTLPNNLDSKKIDTSKGGYNSSQNSVVSTVSKTTQHIPSKSIQATVSKSTQQQVQKSTQSVITKGTQTVAQKNTQPAMSKGTQTVASKSMQSTMSKGAPSVVQKKASSVMSPNTQSTVSKNTQVSNSIKPDISKKSDFGVVEKKESDNKKGKVDNVQGSLALQLDKEQLELNNKSKTVKVSSVVEDDKLEGNFEKGKNVVTGMLGATVGAFAGIFIWVLAYELHKTVGFDAVSEYAAMTMPALMLVGYSRFTDRITVNGLIAVNVVMIFVMFFAMNLTVAINISELEYAAGGKVGFIGAFSLIPDILKNNTANKIAYIKTIAGTYILAAVTDVFVTLIIKSKYKIHIK